MDNQPKNPNYYSKSRSEFTHKNLPEIVRTLLDSAKATSYNQLYFPISPDNQRHIDKQRRVFQTLIQEISLQKYIKQIIANGCFLPKVGRYEVCNYLLRASDVEPNTRRKVQ